MNSVNVYAGKKEDRMMMTGMHTVVDIYCVKCGSYVGWRYVRKQQMFILLLKLILVFYICLLLANLIFINLFVIIIIIQEFAFEKNQKYKEGKSVLERLIPD